MKLVWNQGEEAVCPICHRRNAVLKDGWQEGWIGECRDCKCRFRAIGEMRVIVVADSNYNGRSERDCELD